MSDEQVKWRWGKPLGPRPLCECGCGQKIPRTKHRRTYKRFLKGHQYRVGYQRGPFSAEHRKRLSTAQKRRFKLSPTWSKGHTKRTHPGLAKQSAKVTGSGNPMFGRVLDKHPSWKGGFTIARGYRRVKSADHPRAKSGYVFEHILVAEKHLGRRLRKHEEVHHIQGDRKSLNDWSNLAVLPNCSEHRRAHHSATLLVYELVRSGHVVFNRRTYRYEWGKSCRLTK